MMAPVPMSARHLVNELRHSGRPNFRDRGNGRNYRCLDCGTEGLISPAEWSRWNVSLRLAAALAWPAEPVGVAQPATRRRQGRIPPVLAACIRAMRAA